MQSLDQLFNALLGHHGPTPGDFSPRRFFGGNMAYGAPSASLAVSHGLNAVKSKVQRFFGARARRQEIHAELFRLSRSTELHADLKRAIAGHILRVVGSS